jgi:CheY-like chemotaxis protein
MRSLDRKLTDSSAATSQAAKDEPTVQQFHERPGVLVVDDNELVRMEVQLGLEQSGFDVWLAADGRQGIYLYRRHRDSIDVVLLDVHMPGLDGPATLHALCKLNPEVLVCFMSGDMGDYESEELLRGAVYVIAKPFRLNELVRVLRLLTNGVPADLLHSGGGGQRITGRELVPRMR